jgi:hypothetical protein
MKRSVASGGHEAGTKTSSPCAAIRRFVAARWTHPSDSPKVPACRRVSGV